MSAKGSLGQYKWKQHKSVFEEECSNFVQQRKQAKLQWLQNPKRSNADNLKNVRNENIKHFVNKRRQTI
jgi:hypothetical protein